MSDQDPTPTGSGDGPTSPYAAPQADGSTPAAAASGDQPQPYPYGSPAQPYPYGSPAQPQPYGSAPQPYPYPATAPAYGYGYAPSPPTNQMAVIALVLGIVGLVVLPILASIPAIIVGHMARKQIRERGEGGDGMALAGVITGYIGAVGYTLIFLLILLPFFILAAGTAAGA